MAPRLVLDSSAIIGLSRGNQALWARIRGAADLEAEVCVPAPVVAETLRGSPGRDAPVNWVLGVIDNVKPATEAVARLAAALLGRARMDATVDALVAAESAREVPSILVTSDVADMSRLLDGIDGVFLQRT